MTEQGAVDVSSNLGTAQAPSMFSGATANISGGNFVNIGTNHTIVNINQAPGRVFEDEVKEVLEMLRAYITLRTWNVHQDISGKRAPGTGEEFDSSQDMDLWRDIERSFIWATGAPGAGKTHLASSVFDRLHARTKDSKDTVAVISYIRYNDETTAWDTVMGLIIHIVESKPLPSVLEVIKNGFAEHQQRRSQPTFDQLTQIFRAIVRKYKRCYIILDGVDEAPWEIQMALIMLMSRVLKLVQDRLQDLRSTRAVFVTVAAHDKDLDLYISHVIETNPRLAKLLEDPEMQARLRVEVKAKAEGMFLHVSLQMEALRDCLDVQEVFEVVNDFPTGMDALYTETMKRINRLPPSHAARARRALSWILYSRQPLLLSDLQHAVATFPPDYEVQLQRILCEGDLAMICCGLIAVDYKTRRVRLVHETAQKYLGSLLASECPAPNEMMAITCMGVLQRAGFQHSAISTTQELEAAFASTPLLEYAYRSIGHHIHEALKEHPQFLARVVAFVQRCESFPYHHPLFDPQNPNSVQRLQPLHVASLLNLSTTVSAFIKGKEIDVNARSSCSHGRGWPSLMIACAEGKAQVVRALLHSSRLDVNAVGPDNSTPLMVAAHQGHGDIVQALLKFNTPTQRVLAQASKLIRTTSRGRLVNVNLQNTAGETALLVASRKGHAPVVACLLTVPDIDIHLQSGTGDVAFILACQNDRPEVVSLFIEIPGVDSTCRDGNGRTALDTASQYASREVVALLLGLPGSPIVYSPTTAPHIFPAFDLALRHDRSSVVQVFYDIPGLDIYASIWGGWTSLMVAAQHGSEAVVGLLLSLLGTSISYSPLIAAYIDPAFDLALRNDKPGVVRLFHGIPGLDPDAKIGEGMTSLMAASRYGSVGVVELLLSLSGALITYSPTSAPYIDPAFDLAVQNDQREVVKQFLAIPGFDPNQVDEKGRTGLMKASYHGCKNLVKIFLAIPNIKVDISDNDGRSALLLACQKGHKNVVELLLAIPSIQDSIRHHHLYRQSVFMTACLHYHVELAKHFLDISELDPNFVDDDSGGQTMLISAAQAGNECAVELLLATPKVNPNIRDDKGRSALIVASFEGYSGIVRRLLAESRVRVNLEQHDGNTALTIACSRNHLEVIKLLLAVPDTQLNIQTHYGRSALMLAAGRSGDDVRAVEHLLAHEQIDVNSVDIFGNTALTGACLAGNEEIVEVLLADSRTDVHMRNDHGKSALDIAKDMNRREIAKLLLGAAVSKKRPNVQPYHSRYNVRPRILFGK